MKIVEKIYRTPLLSKGDYRKYVSLMNYPLETQEEAQKIIDIILNDRYFLEILLANSPAFYYVLTTGILKNDTIVLAIKLKTYITKYLHQTSHYNFTNCTYVNNNYQENKIVRADSEWLGHVIDNLNKEFRKFQ